MTTAGASITVAVGAAPAYAVGGGTGPFTATSSSTSVATVTLAGITLTVTGIAAGNTNVVVRDSAGASITVAVAVPVQQSTATASMSMDVLSGAGVSTNSISVVEISKVQIALKDAAGHAVAGVVVTFAETGAGLLTFAPASKTALTDATGVTSIEIRAASTSSVGATMVGASATVSGRAISAQTAIAITSTPAGGATSDPQALAHTLNFLDVNPADKSIVLQGAGGNGRSESATLRFRVVDKNNTPVKGATVTFEVVPSRDVTLNITSSISDFDGVVVTTVSSGNVATAVVIKATVTRANGSTITSQSDQLLVTTGVATQAGFDLSATKYNLNFGISGDKTTITVRIVDTNGNPVADGVPVVFTANFGAVGTSSRGGCITLSGGCSVDYSVQNPRPKDGQQATVIASTRLGNGTSISGSLAFNFVDVSLLNLFNTSTGGTVVTTFDFPPGVCGSRTFSRFAGTPGNFPAPAGTTVSLFPITSDLAVTLKSDKLILDQIASTPSRTTIDIEVDLPKMLSPNSCDILGSSAMTALLDVKFVADSTSVTRRITVNYFGLP